MKGNILTTNEYESMKKINNRSTNDMINGNEREKLFSNHIN